MTSAADANSASWGTVGRRPTEVRSRSSSAPSPRGSDNPSVIVAASVVVDVGAAVVVVVVVEGVTVVVVVGVDVVVVVVAGASVVVVVVASATTASVDVVAAVAVDVAIAATVVVVVSVGMSVIASKAGGELSLAVSESRPSSSSPSVDVEEVWRVDGARVEGLE